MKKGIQIWLVLATAGILGIVGCEKDGQQVAANGNKDKLMKDLADTAIFLRVNGQSFTKHDFLVASSLFDKITRLRAGDSLTTPNAAAERATELRQPYTVSEIQRRALMGQFAQKNKVVASEKNLKEAVDRFLGLINRKKSTLAEVVAEIGGEEGKLLEAYIRGDALDLTLREAFDTEHRLQITEQDVLNISNRWQKSVTSSAASNEFERAQLTAAIAEIKTGKAFADVAAKYSLVPEEAKEWEDLDGDDIQEENPLTAWVKGAKPGDVSGILELEDGYSVVKLLTHEKEAPDPDDKDDDDDPMNESWQLVRICRKSWEPFAPMKHDEIVSELYKNRSRDVQKRIGDAIMATAEISWPCGTNLFKIVEARKTTVKKRVKADKQTENRK